MAKYYAQQWNIKSFTDDDKEYKVSRCFDDHYECSCPRWIFARKQLPNGECKHIIAVKEMMINGMLIEAKPVITSRWQVVPVPV